MPTSPTKYIIMDESSLLFRCLSNRAYVTAGRWRRARGINAMSTNDLVTLRMQKARTRSWWPLLELSKFHFCVKPGMRRNNYRVMVSTINVQESSC